MKRYVAVLGRQPLISVAELESLFENVRAIYALGNKGTGSTRGEKLPVLAEFSSKDIPNIHRLGGTLKIAEKVLEPLPVFLKNLPERGKITVGVSDFSRESSAFLAQKEALKIKRMLAKDGRSVRVVPNKTAILSSATSLHNHLFSDTKIEILKNGPDYYKVVQLQDIESYVQRDRKRPARDAKVGMLPPKLAQILINLCGDLPKGTRLLDPFCGTGVVLQEATLIGYVPYGTDLSERMVEYSKRNLEWLKDKEGSNKRSNEQNIVKITTFLEKAECEVGDAQNFQWQMPVGAVACETYLGPPMSQAPVDIKLKQAKQECKGIIIGFLKNLAKQIDPDVPVVIAVPAWLRDNGRYERLNILDEIDDLRYNVVRFKNLRQKDLLYYRDGQVVAREIIVLRKK